MTAEGGPAAAFARWGAVAATALSCVAVTSLSAVAGPAGEPEAAYWWQPEPVSGLFPVPGVPSNGLYVASSPTGPQAESAVRFSVANPTAYVQLTLHVSMQERVGTPAVIAYPATSHWQTGGPQPWSARPSYRARAKPVRGNFGHNGSLMTLTFPAHEAATGIVLLPDPKGSSKTFTIAFAPPHSADIEVRATATHTPSPSSSQTPSHHPTPGKTHHSATPSSRPTHPHKTKSPSTSPSATSSPTTGTSPTPTGSATTPGAPSTQAHSEHGARNVLIIALPLGAVLLTLVWFLRGAASRRRPPDEG